MIRRRTLGRPLARSGRGLRSGRFATAAVLPAGWGAGLVVERDGRRAKVCEAHAHAVSGMTALRAPGVSVDLLEHLLAALVGAGITDARVVVHGSEVPILDGSSAGWAEAIEVAEGPPTRPLVIHRPLVVRGFGGEVHFRPSSTRRVSVSVDFGGPWVGEASVVLGGEQFRDAVADARTFVRAVDVVALRAAGRGGAASVENTLVLHPQHAEGLRMADEPVRHKLLDAVGDLAWVGRPVLGHVHVVRGSHRLHLEAVRALLAER